MGIKPGMEILVLNAPDGVEKLLGELPEGAKLSFAKKKNHEFVLAFVRSAAEVKKIGPGAIKLGIPEGALWLAYPKKTGSIKTDISRDVGWEALDALKYRPVTQISIDDTWTGFRFRPIALVKKK